MNEGKILINNELPSCLLDKNDELNDYDFILYHLFVKEPSYREFFTKRMREGKRMTILDNSAYEFYKSGESLDVANFIDTVKEFQPTYCIVPDVLMDSKQTLDLWELWKGFSLGSTKKMIIPQGKSLKEWLYCYEVMTEDESAYDCIGIPFHNDFFWDLGLITQYYLELNNIRPIGSVDKDDIYYSQGRLNLLVFLVKRCMIRPGKKYHLLGSHWYEELKMIKEVSKRINLSWINSIDTSFPVTRGICYSELSNKERPKEVIGIDDFYNMDLNKIQKKMVINNIKKYHTYGAL